MPAMAVAAGRSAKRENDKRMAIATKRHDEEVRLMQMLQTYDKDGSGTLGKSELGDLLEDYNQGRRPDEDEIEWIFNVADKKGPEGAESSRKIELSEVKTAVNAWQAYQTNKEHIDAAFAKYDTDKSGKLEHADLKLLLRDLNNNIDPTDAEVQMIMDKANEKGQSDDNAISRIEVTSAVAIWYQHLDDKNAEAAALKLQESGCCVVM
mmetsp:Transcript_68245/g.162893  ORF Transcript_68245/g.162893 Transcript_68245/m.162893 type:complete len:208 (-) Transcript_68245:61-684(-)